MQFVEFLDFAIGRVYAKRDCYRFKSMECLLDKAKRRFRISIENHANVILQSLASLLREEEVEANRTPWLFIIYSSFL